MGGSGGRKRVRCQYRERVQGGERIEDWDLGGERSSRRKRVGLGFASVMDTPTERPQVSEYSRVDRRGAWSGLDRIKLFGKTVSVEVVGDSITVLTWMEGEKFTGLFGRAAAVA